MNDNTTSRNKKTADFFTKEILTVMNPLPFLPLKGSKTRVVCPPLTDYQVTTIDY